MLAQIITHNCVFLVGNSESYPCDFPIPSDIGVSDGSNRGGNAVWDLKMFLVSNTLNLGNYICLCYVICLKKLVFMLFCQMLFSLGLYMEYFKDSFNKNVIISVLRNQRPIEYTL